MAVFSLLTDEQKAELWSCLALKHSRGLGLHSANALIEHYGSALEAVELGRRAPGCWVSEGLVNERTAKTFAKESWREKARGEWEALQQPRCQFLYRTHPHYPHLLTAIHDAPLTLYYTGDIGLLANPMIGVVGSRRCSEQGILACATLARQLSSFGVTIVSGLAKGIDRAAHIAGLSSLGSSVAVLGTGIDIIYPESNDDVFKALEEKGLILSEFAPGTLPYAKNFPIRNRIISGLSRGVIIVEAAKRSGSLITARLALEQGRDVFAIPGSSVGKYSEGCHELIRNGAKPVFSAEDVILDLAPLLAVDIQKQLQRLQQEETPESLSKFAMTLSGTSGLPPLVEQHKNPQNHGYRYGQGPEEATVVEGSRIEGSRIDGSRGSALVETSAPELSLSDIIPDTISDTAPQEIAIPEPSRQEAVLSEASFQGYAPQGYAPDATLFNETTAEETALEARLLTLLQDDWRHIDWLSERLGLEASAVSTALTVLEVSGVVVQKPGMYYRLP